MPEQAPQYTPDEHAALCLLQYLSKDQLSEFLSNQDKLNSHIADLEQVLPSNHTILVEAKDKRSFCAVQRLLDIPKQEQLCQKKKRMYRG